MRRLKQVMAFVQSAMLVLALWPTAPAHAAGKIHQGKSQTEAPANTITVTFKNGDGTSIKTTVELSQSDELGDYGILQKPENPSRDSKDGIRYVFDKWLFEDGADAFVDQDSIQVGGTKNITLTAQWTEYLAKGYVIRAIYGDDFKILSDYQKPIQEQVKGATEYTVEPAEEEETATISKSAKGNRNAITVAKIGEDGYESLEAAITAATQNDTIVLQQDYVLPSTVVINKSITLDLDGHTLTCACKRDLKKRIEIAPNAEVTITGGSDAQNLGTIVNGETLTQEDESGAAMIKNEGTLTIENVSITSGDACVWAKAGELNINDGATITSTYGNAVATNGSASGTATYSNGATVNIKGGTITSTNSVSVYVPAGTFNIIGGTITGATGVYMKGGVLSITGGTIRGNGTNNEYSYVTGDAKPTGDALVIDVCGYPFGSDPAITVTGGSFTSDNANAVGSYAYSAGGYTAKTHFLSGGEYSNKPADDCLAEGCNLEQDGDGNWCVSHTHTYDYDEPDWAWRRINGDWSAAAIYTCTKCDANETVQAEVTSDASSITAIDSSHNKTGERTITQSYQVTLDGEAKGNYNWGDLATLEASNSQPKKWFINGREVADGRASYTFAVTENAVVTTATTNKADPVAVINATLTSNGSSTATYNVKWSLPLGAVVNSVVIYRGHTGSSTDVSANTIIARGTAHDTGLLVRNGDYTLKLKDLTSGKHQHVVTKIAYTVYGVESVLVSEPCSLYAN